MKTDVGTPCATRSLVSLSTNGTAGESNIVEATALVRMNARRRGFIALSIALLLSSVPSLALADETVLSESTVTMVRLACDTQEEVSEFLKYGDKREIAGCGSLSRPMRVRIVAVGMHKGERYSFLIVRYDFLDTLLPPQYGVGGRKDNGIDT